MAWIESHQKLKDHPKVHDLMIIMEWNLDEAIGKLHRFWWWCLDYAEDGNLLKHNDDRLGAAVGVLPGEPAKRFVAALVQSCWVDREPYFRVHDWWDFSKYFLMSKYKRSPRKWKQIRNSYATVTQPLNQTKPNRTNQTKPNSPVPQPFEKSETKNGIPTDLLPNAKEIQDWLGYKREKGQAYKPRGLNALWSALRKIPAANRKASIDRSMASNYAGIFEAKTNQKEQPKSEAVKFFKDTMTPEEKKLKEELNANT